MLAISSLRQLYSFLLGSLVIVCLLAYQVTAEQSEQSTSVGTPNNGRLRRAAELDLQGQGYFFNPNTTNKVARYGTTELVDAIIRVGSDLARWAPGATLYVNDLSLRKGGPLPRHQSHQAGRDVDIMFVLLDPNGKVIPSRAVRILKNGKGIWKKVLSNRSMDRLVFFDKRRNWLVLRSLIENTDAHVQRVFVAEHVRKILLDYAHQHNEPDWVIARAAEVMCEPALPHVDHFHVRLFCTAEDYLQGCRDEWPIYPWRRTELASQGIPAVETVSLRPVVERLYLLPSLRNRSSGKRLWCP